MLEPSLRAIGALVSGARSLEGGGGVVVVCCGCGCGAHVATPPACQAATSSGRASGFKSSVGAHLRMLPHRRRINAYRHYLYRNTPAIYTSLLMPGPPPTTVLLLHGLCIFTMKGTS